MKKLSIIIPAFNEAKTIATLLRTINRVAIEAQGFEKEILVVDDGSNDDTVREVRQFPNVTCLSQKNQGKGAAVQHGIRSAGGDYVLVQDADLEYDPNDYPALVEPIGSHASVAVYGSRTLGQMKNTTNRSLWPGKHPEQGLGPWFANLILSLWTFFLYGQWISDPLTGYKVYPMSFLRGVTVKTSGFETDHELTAKLIRSGIPIVEVPVAYRPRSVQEGKKIRARDGWIAMWTLLRFRFTR